MQRRASSCWGAVIAPVGQTGMQAEQLPQCALAGSSMFAYRLQPVVPRVRYAERDERDDVDERYAADTPYQPGQHADRPPTERKHRLQVPSVAHHASVIIVIRSR